MNGLGILQGLVFLQGLRVLRGVLGTLKALEGFRGVVGGLAALLQDKVGQHRRKRQVREINLRYWLSCLHVILDRTFGRSRGHTWTRVVDGIRAWREDVLRCRSH